MPTEPLPDEAWLVALAELDGMGPARLRRLLDVYPPARAWARVAAGTVDTEAVAIDRVDRWSVWRQQAAAVDVGARWARYRRRGVGVFGWNSAAYPEVLAGDVEPPAVVCVEGDPSAMVRPSVAVVGTRRCSHYGREVARELGRDLAGAGVCVVSGLALGIDGAAHTGALEAALAPPVAVVAGGLDHRYPTRHSGLWDAVAAAGAVVTEAPLGVAPDRWRFPARNRIIAALADVVVVVESNVAGGSMHTVDEALRRDVAVMAVPGPIRSATSAGTNRLLSEGCAPVCSTDDVVAVLGLTAGARPRRRLLDAPSESAAEVLGAFCWQPVDLEVLVNRTGRSVAVVSLAVEELLAKGWVVRRRSWLERVAVS